MPSYRVHRLKDHLRNHFRAAPHVSGTANVKPRDYELSGEVESSSPYSAFFLLKDSETALQPGDILEAPDQSLRIFKYVGFEEARWVLPEVKPEVNPEVNPEEAAAAGTGTAAPEVLATV
jgi:hypothetical protein